MCPGFSNVEINAHTDTRGVDKKTLEIEKKKQKTIDTVVTARAVIGFI